MPKLRITSEQLVEQARTAINYIPIGEAIDLLGSDQVLFVDVRELEEYMESTIRGSIHTPRGWLEFLLDPDSGFQNPDLITGKKMILFCGSGGRSTLATKLARDMGYDAVCLQGGLKAWIAANGPTERFSS